MAKRKQHTVREQLSPAVNFNGSLQELGEALISRFKDYTSQGYTDLNIVEDCHYESPHDYYVWGTRDETNKERVKRLDITKQSKVLALQRQANRVEIETKRYKQLKKKYKA